MHGYIAKSIENDPKTDYKTAKSWTRNKDMSSEFEAYAFAIKDQEIATKNKGKTAERKYIKHHHGYKMQTL